NGVATRTGCFPARERGRLVAKGERRRSRYVRELVAQTAAATMPVALRRSDGHVRSDGDLFEREPERIFEDDDAGLLGRDLRKTAIELAAQLRSVGLPGGIRVGRGSTVLEQRLTGPGALPV